MTIRLSRLARKDLDDIRRYTLGPSPGLRPPSPRGRGVVFDYSDRPLVTWGREQWNKYYRGMVRAFESIRANPDGGRDRGLFAPGMRSVNYRSHIIFFARIVAAGDNPVILRIVHQRRHLPALVYFEDLED